MKDEVGSSANRNSVEGTNGDAGRRASRGFSRGKLAVFVGLGLCILIGAGAGAYIAGLVPGSNEPAKAVAAPPAAHYLDLDEVVVTLGSGEKPGLLRLHISLELEDPADEARIRGILPLIMDNFQAFLRELRTEELRGSHGLYRIKEELLVRVNAMAHPTRVRQVLLKEMLVQ